MRDPLASRHNPPVSARFPMRSGAPHAVCLAFRFNDVYRKIPIRPVRSAYILETKYLHMTDRSSPILNVNGMTSAWLQSSTGEPIEVVSEASSHSHAARQYDARECMRCCVTEMAAQIRTVGQDSTTFYVVYTPRSIASLQILVNVAGRRWEIETSFEATKGECGLDHYEVRRWRGWHRHITLALLAHAVLVTLRIEGKKTPEGKMPLSPQEIRRLLCRLLWRAVHLINHVIAWSIWRRTH
ncbi:transposase [Burkholderia oklahomensis]|uniref:transposase n=2 Tax=Burkholderia oklahomensis TaxID=342113 RepID=UPI0009E41122